MLRLSAVRRNGTLERRQQDSQGADCLVLDERGYVPVERDGSQLRFSVIADSYETRCLILPTNLECSKWGSLFTDDPGTAAMIDRRAHHGPRFLCDDENYPMTHALMNER